ncbi:DB module domain-containing protein [Ditylenchus destructor]|nr:DB module domain-containing protein [Ditylenchus destructor]
MFNIFKFIFFLGFFHLTISSVDEPDESKKAAKNEKFQKCCEENGVTKYLGNCNYDRVFNKGEDEECKKSALRNGGNVSNDVPERANAKLFAEGELDPDTLFDKEMIAYQKCYAESKDVTKCCQDSGVTGDQCLQFCKPSDTMVVGNFVDCLCYTKIIATCVYNHVYND